MTRHFRCGQELLRSSDDEKYNEATGRYYYNNHSFPSVCNNTSDKIKHVDRFEAHKHVEGSLLSLLSLFHPLEHSQNNYLSNVKYLSSQH
ncbi:CLUMA_CG003796, isoform A [Clunio marinus]|uniref:CLUMA_CG003796, isoform A n=1 Tax=Clunio marinus TaxID=568069 RepID=A0A1J1HPW4_9DIPT|nr:CLUMA_CG003796, isoform A [Clunio marinus]